MDANKIFEENFRWVRSAAAHWLMKLTVDWNIHFFDYDDLVQISSYAMFKAITTYDESRKVKLQTWVHTHINNEILSEVRKFNKNVKATSITTPEDDNTEFDIESYENGYDQVEDGILAGNIKSILTEREYQVLWMFAVEGMSQTDIAPTIGVQQPQVYRILKNIRKKVEEFCQH
jgi:RNA polymerase sporulation-specific sigma factor